ncbi:MAG: glycine zipper domain-containing protein [Verrucomicrobiota bacterium]
MNYSPLIFVSGLALVATTFTSCETPGQGAANGAIAGAVIGAVATGDIRGAAIGAGAGAATGAVAGAINRDERRARYSEYDRDREYGLNGERPIYVDRRHLMATPTNRYGYVTSPYRPYALIDVRGIRHGARVEDPASGRVFINP